MTGARTLNLTAGEQRRVAQIDQLVATRGIDELLASMSDPSWTVRRASVAALAALGDDAVGPLCTWLRERRTDEHAIAAAVDALSTACSGRRCGHDPRPATCDRGRADARPGDHASGR
jgi:hypothetical protein